jgi:purine-nucleoside/S-methyl-5'-thioadenosine phosphorylase / adenosine deaminase
MVFIKALIFEQFPEILFGFSTKVGNGRKPPYNFNMSLSVNDETKVVAENRSSFFSAVGLNDNEIALQKQVHKDEISIVDVSGISGESDAMITNKIGLGLAVSTADCTPIFLYDKENKVIAGVHSGWRSTEKKILKKTLDLLKTKYGSSSQNLFVYIGPSISQKNYEVGKEVAEKFDKKYLTPKEEKFLLDIPRANYDFLIDFNVPPENIQLSSLCTYDNDKLLHSYRREGKESGRALGVIAMR